MASSLEDLSPEQRQQLNRGKLLDLLLTNPKTAEATKRAITQVDEKIKFPDLEVRDSMKQLREETAKKLADQEAEIKRLRAESKQKELHAKVTDAGLTVEDVVKVLEKHGMASTDENYDLAIKVLRQDQMLAEPTPSDFETFKTPDVKEMWADPVAWRQREAEKVLKELRGGRIQ
jgi:hypothetical protein